MDSSAPPYATRIVRGVLAGAAATLVSRAAGFIALPLLVTILGLPLFGAWVLASTLIGTQGLFDLGMSAFVARYMGRAESMNDGYAARRILKVSLTVTGIISLAVGGVVIALSRWLPLWLHVPAALVPQASLVFVGAAVLFAISSLMVTCMATLQGLQRIDLTNAALVAGQLVYVAALGIVAMSGGGVVHALLAISALYLVPVVIMAPVIVARLPDGPAAKDMPHFAEFLSFGGSVQLSSIIDFGALQIPKLIAGALLGVGAAAQMDIALRLPLAVASLTLVVLPPMLPAAARLSARHDDARLRSLGIRGTRYLAVVAMPAYAAVFWVGPLVMAAWVGPAAHGLEAPIRILSIALLAHALPGALTTIALGLGRARFVLRYKVVLIVCTVGLVPAAAWLWGLVGICGGLAAAWVVSMGYIFVCADTILGGAGHRLALGAIARPLVAVGLACAVGVGAHTALSALDGWLVAIVATMIGVISYAALAPVTGSFTRRDLEDVLRHTRGRGVVEPLGEVR